MRSEATNLHKPVPYIFDYYNPRTYFTNPKNDSKSVMARILNSIAKGLNANSKLPKYVLVVPDKDLLSCIPKNYSERGMEHLMYECIKFMITEINKLFDARKDAIRNKKAGAMSTSLEPRIIWVSMISRTPARIAMTDDLEVYFYRKNFNEILNEQILKDQYSHFINITSVDNYTDFDRSGLLSAAGKLQFWREVIDSLKKFDRLKTDLKPVLRH